MTVIPTLTTPVAFLIFNRPEVTGRVFEAIRKAQPRTLLIVADGARPDRPDEGELVAQTRAVVERIDWDCVVHKNYADANLGLKARISSGIDWVFSLVEEVIILEDDCLPDSSFFRFCQELLDRYRHNEAVMHIAGCNVLKGKYLPNASYYFSYYPAVWGWATWRRAWQHYDVSMQRWRTAPSKDVYLKQIDDPSERGFWRHTFDAVSSGEFNTWDYQWVFACFAQNGFAINPSQNLVSNIGFGAGATNTFSEATPGGNLPTSPIAFPLKHPERVEQDRTADRLFAEMFYGRGSPAPLQQVSWKSAVKAVVKGRMYQPLKSSILGRALSRLADKVVDRIDVRFMRFDYLLHTLRQQNETQLLLLGDLHSRRVQSLPAHAPIEDAEFKVFSEGGEDGIIQYLISHTDISNKVFVEFGVANYLKANTRYLALHDRWSGLIIERIQGSLDAVRAELAYTPHNIVALPAFVTAENINHLLAASGLSGEIGLLSIDVGGNDFWIWKALEVVNPIIVVCEVNRLFGCDHAVTIPYHADFDRSRAHYSRSFYGASLPALCCLGTDKGYAFVGTNRTGTNAFFVRQDKAQAFRTFSPQEFCAQSQPHNENEIEKNLLRLMRDCQVYDINTAQTMAIKDLYKL